MSHWIVCQVLILLLLGEPLDDRFETGHDFEVLIERLLVHLADLLFLILDIQHSLVKLLPNALDMVLILLGEELVFANLYEKSVGLIARPLHF